MNASVDGLVVGSYEEPKSPIDNPFKKFERFAKWIHEHPKAVKIAVVSAIVLGLAAAALVPYTMPVLGVGIGIAMASGGTGTALLSVVAYKTFRTLIGFQRDPSNHVFACQTLTLTGKGRDDVQVKLESEEVAQGVDVATARLSYTGDIPIMRIESPTHYLAGQLHGRVLSDSIQVMRRTFGRFLKLGSLFSRDLAGSAGSIPQVINAVKNQIPPEYLEEIEGLVDGFNEAIKEKPWMFRPSPLTVDEVIFLHLIPELTHFKARAAERAYVTGQVPDALRTTTAFPDCAGLNAGCTVIATKDEQGKVVVGRNMDWPGFGILGDYCLVSKIKVGDKNSFSSVGIPVLVGAGTGMNEHGLVAAINVALGVTNQVEGRPSLFCVREILESCRTVVEADSLAKKHDKRPLGPFHLSLADSTSAKTLHMFQKDCGRNHAESSLEESGPLVVTNWRFDGERKTCTEHGYSGEREEDVRRLHKDHHGSTGEFIRKAMALPRVNNCQTVQAVTFYPQDRRMDVALDNSFAASLDLEKIAP